MRELRENRRRNTRRRAAKNLALLKRVYLIFIIRLKGVINDFVDLVRKNLPQVL